MTRSLSTDPAQFQEPPQFRVPRSRIYQAMENIATVYTPIRLNSNQLRDTNGLLMKGEVIKLKPPRNISGLELAEDIVSKERLTRTEATASVQGVIRYQIHAPTKTNSGEKQFALPKTADHAGHGKADMCLETSVTRSNPVAPTPTTNFQTVIVDGNLVKSMQELQTQDAAAVTLETITVTPVEQPPNDDAATQNSDNLDAEKPITGGEENAEVKRKPRTI
ncbi:hypothetical protein T440DRAFT_473684 [Plenodomus tracheiphilus IPT5]|uniref:Uncharacterized protein n=1 Tax=Plenodomus tracheiphilus IPT5 TaxID=1408161 RepID=A0A6A7APR8_9PLEO|nr:hypothetical protein T440DRAFT_473684 [Plenodomus tracheiphilus IPT5]